MGVAIATLLSKLLHSVLKRAGLHDNISSFLKSMLFLSISVSAILIALAQLNVPQHIISAIISHILQWLFIGIAIAFGLGGRLLAADILASFKLKKIYPKGAEVEYDNVQGALKEVGWFDSLVYTEKGIINIPNSVLARKTIKRQI